MKKYLWIGPNIVLRNARYLIDLKDALKWVDTPEEATADYESRSSAKRKERPWAWLGNRYLDPLDQPPTIFFGFPEVRK